MAINSIKCDKRGTTLMVPAKRPFISFKTQLLIKYSGSSFRMQSYLIFAVAKRIKRKVWKFIIYDFYVKLIGNVENCNFTISVALN